MPGWNESVWFAMLVSVALKSTVVLGAAWLLTHILRRRSAAARHLVWTAAAAALLALPVLSAIMPALPIQSRALRSVIPPLVFRVTAVAKGDSAATNRPLAATHAPSTPGTDWLPDYRFWLPLIWAAGTALGLSQMLMAAAMMRRLRRTSTRPDSPLFFALAHAFDIHDRVELIEAAEGAMPMNFGVLQPAVVIPADATNWSEERRRVVLLHELAHVKRGDVATNLLMRSALCLFWWNPLAWTAWRESVKERERAADDLVLAAGEAATGYATHLLDIARSMQSATPNAWAAIAMARPSQLEGRLLAILDSRIHRNQAGPRAALAAGILAIALVAPFAAVQGQDKIDPVSAPVVDAAIRAATEQKNHDILDNTAAAFETSRKYEAAQKLLENSLVLRGETAGEHSSAYAVGLMKLGDLSEKRNKAADALDFYSRAVALGDTPETAQGLVYLASHALSGGDPVKAANLIDRALAVAPQGSVSSRATTVKGDIALANGLPGLAESEYSLALSQEAPDSPEAVATVQKYTRLLYSQNRTAEAQALLAQTRPLTQFRTDAQMVYPATAAAGTYRVGNGILPPTLLYKSEPEYTEAARAAKHQGTVLALPSHS